MYFRLTMGILHRYVSLQERMSNENANNRSLQLLENSPGGRAHGPQVAVSFQVYLQVKLRAQESLSQISEKFFQMMVTMVTKL